MGCNCEIGSAKSTKNAFAPLRQPEMQWEERQKSWHWECFGNNKGVKTVGLHHLDDKPGNKKEDKSEHMESFDKKQKE